MTDHLVFDLETYSADDWYRRNDHLRLGGFDGPNGRVLTTDAERIVKEIAEGGGQISGHNICAYDLPILALHHGLDLTALRGRAIDTDPLVRLDDPPPSGHKGSVSFKLRPRGYYGLDQSCVRYGVAHKTGDLAEMARQGALMGKRITKGRYDDLDETGVVKFEAEYGMSLDRARSMLADSTGSTGKIDGYGMIDTEDTGFRSYLNGDLTASRALVEVLSPLNDYAKREMTVGLATAQMMVNGFRTDVPELKRTLAEQEVRRREHLIELHMLTGMPLSGVMPIRSNAGNAAIERFLIEQGLKTSSLPRAEKTGKLATGKDAIGEFLTRIRKAAKGRDITKIERALELVVLTSGERTIYGTIDDVRKDDRTHVTIKATQASGRWSAGFLTVMGKRDGRYVERRVMLPEDGEVLVSFDLDQVDARGVAAHSGDENYLSIFRDPNADLHGSVAREVFGHLITDDGSFRHWREQVKPLNHGLNYRMGPKLAAEHTGLPLDVVLTYIRGMQVKYPKVVTWQNEMSARAQAGEILDNGFGRRLRADPAFGFTQGPALVGQGCTRDIIATWLLRLPVEFWKHMKVIVHDEIVFSLPIAHWREMAEVIRQAATFDLAEVTEGRLASCPITVGMSKPGKNWAECYMK